MVRRNHTVLIVVDVQGNLANLIDNKDIVYENIEKVIRGCRVLKIPVILTEQVNLGPTIPEITDFIPEVVPIIKESFSCCDCPEFVAALASCNRKQILLAGIETHVCVYNTARDLVARGYEVHIVADAVSSRTAMNRDRSSENKRLRCRLDKYGDGIV
jgi:nicotinamidase-related amidase